jgi:ParB-like chromosome segregation protein Spo0J
MKRASGEEKKPKTYRLVHVDDLVPNTWNFNRMTGEMFKLLKQNIKKCKDKGLPMPSVPTVRPHPTLEGKDQIINGEHRWRAYKELFEAGDERFAKIPVIWGEYDDKDAMLMTDELNEVHGEANTELQAQYFHTLNTELRVPLVEIAERLPYTKDEVESFLTSYELPITHIDVAGESSDEKPKKEEKPEDWMELRFVVTREQAILIEAEISRLATTLNGKNVRGRSLEFMAVQSSQTPLVSLETGSEEMDEAMEAELEQMEQAAKETGPSVKGKLKDAATKKKKRKAA